MTITEGIHDLSFADYLAHPGYGSSDLKTFRAGPPAAVQWRRNNRFQTDATRIGSAAHCRILTPQDFARDYAIKPEGMEFRSAENKAIRDMWLAEGRTILSAEEADKVDSVTDAFFLKMEAATSLGRARLIEIYEDETPQIELSVFWRCRESGLLRKCRPDWFEGSFTYDLKVTIAADKGEDRLSYLAHCYGWLNQAAGARAGLLANGVDCKGARLVLVSPNPPHNVWLLELSEGDCDFLELENENTCRAMAECERKGEWPGTPETWKPIELPMSATWTEIDSDGAEEVVDV